MSYPVAGERRRVLLDAYRRHLQRDLEGTSDLETVCAVLNEEGFTRTSIAAVLEPDAHALGQHPDLQGVVNRVMSWERRGREHSDVHLVRRVVYEPELTAQEIVDLKVLRAHEDGHRGVSAEADGAEVDRVEFARLLLVAALRGVRPGTMSSQLGLPYEALHRQVNSAWTRWVGTLPAEPDPFVGTILREDPDQRWSTAAPTQFHLAAGSGFARDAAGTVAVPATPSVRKRVQPHRAQRTPLSPPPVYEFTSENTPRSPSTAPPAKPADRGLSIEQTGRHHDATSALRAAAEWTGYNIRTPSRGQDASFIVEGTLVNIETKTVTLTSTVTELPQVRTDAPGEVTGRFSGSAVAQLRLGLGQVLEQAQMHRDDLDAGWEGDVVGSVERCAAVLAAELGERRPDATWVPVRVDNLDADSASVWDRWQRTCARAGVTLITVSALEHLITDGTTDWETFVVPHLMGR